PHPLRPSSALSLLDCHSLLPSPPPPRSSTPFPYTTLFRSCTNPSCSSWTSRPWGSTRSHAMPSSNRWRPCPARAWRCYTPPTTRSEEHTSELQSRENLVCRLLLEKNKQAVEEITRADLTTR